MYDDISTLVNRIHPVRQTRVSLSIRPTSTTRGCLSRVSCNRQAKATDQLGSSGLWKGKTVNEVLRLLAVLHFPICSNCPMSHSWDKPRFQSDKLDNRKNRDIWLCVWKNQPRQTPFERRCGQGSCATHVWCKFYNDRAITFGDLTVLKDGMEAKMSTHQQHLVRYNWTFGPNEMPFCIA